MNPMTAPELAAALEESERDTIARLTRERDEAVEAAVEQRERYYALCGKFHEMANSESNKALRTTVERLTRELHRLAHGNTIEGDGVCEHEVEAARLLRDLAAETATRTALRTQESRIMGILADAGVPVGDVVRGVEALARRNDALSAEVNALHQELADMDPNATAQARAERDAALAQASAMHRRAQAAEGQLGRVERLRESHAVEVGRLISRRRWEVSLWRGRYQRARAWSRLWHREARRLWRDVQDLTDELLEVIDGQ